MENKESKKHVQVPNDIDWNALKKGDKIIFANIKRFCNKQTMECHPRLETIAEKCGYSTKRIQIGIKRLEEAGLLTAIKRKGTSTVYKFHKIDDFERFTDKFLDTDLDPQIKEYYMDLQHYLFVNPDTGEANTTFSDSEIAKKTGLCIRTVKLYNKALIEADILTETTTTLLDESGFPIIQKTFDLKKLHQSILYKFKEQDDKINKNTDEINSLKDEIKQLKKELARIRYTSEIKEEINIPL